LLGFELKELPSMEMPTRHKRLRMRADQFRKAHWHRQRGSNKFLFLQLIFETR
jgi:RecB family exonuclease